MLLSCANTEALPTQANVVVAPVSWLDLLEADNRFEGVSVIADLCINATIHDVTLEDCMVESPQFFLEADTGPHSNKEYMRLVDFGQKHIGTPSDSLPVRIQGKYKRTSTDRGPIHTIYIQDVLKLRKLPKNRGQK